MAQPHPESVVAVRGVDQLVVRQDLLRHALVDPGRFGVFPLAQEAVRFFPRVLSVEK